MTGLLSKLFAKRGITSVNELSPDEQATFKKWDAILSEGDITVEKIVEFCENQLKVISWQL